jgi:flagellar export protein FliJ
MSDFRLATLERLREQRLQGCARELHEATLELTAAQERRNALQERLREDLLGSFPSAHELELDSNYRYRLRGDIHEVIQEIIRLDVIFNERRTAWLRARADVHAVAALHERYRRSRRAVLARREQRELDERAGTRRPAGIPSARESQDVDLGPDDTAVTS